MMAVIAEGRTFDRDDTLVDANMQGCPILCRISAQDIHTLQNKQFKAAASSNSDATKEEDVMELPASKPNIWSNRCGQRGG